MGRRSSPDQWPFYRSVFSWFVPWALVAVIVGIGVWVAVDAMSGGPSNAKPPTTALAAGSASPSPSRSAASKPSPSETPSPQATKQPKPKRKVPLITEGITVQVLDATSVPAASDEVATRLGALGFKIVAVASASTDYARTTVFWAYPSAQPAAKALASHFGWVSAPKPSNLSPEVALHVVVGNDGI